jgi:hypothetical protein
VHGQTIQRAAEGFPLGGLCPATEGAMGTPEDDMDEIRSAIRQLQAEMAWVRAMLTGQKPSEASQRTSPPWLTSVSLIAVPIITAIIATKPWS